MIQERRIVRKDENLGVTPSIILCNPKDMHNIGGVLRAANCFGFKQVWYTGDRIEIDSTPRIPRELRMKKYDQVDFFQCDYPFDCFVLKYSGKNTLPIFENNLRSPLASFNIKEFNNENRYDS